MELSKKQETFSENFFAVSKSTLNFEHFPKKTKILIADLFPKLRTPKNVLK